VVSQNFLFNYSGAIPKKYHADAPINDSELLKKRQWSRDDKPCDAVG
jgi:hypothetical protein